MFRGTFTALVTPFRDGGIDVPAFQKLIEAQITAGITGVVAVGTTGESPTLSRVERVSELRGRLPESFTILSGDDSLTLPFMSVGAVGVVSVASNLFPAEVCSLVRAYESGDVKSAQKSHRQLFPLFKDLFIEPN